MPLALSKQKRIMFTIDPLHVAKANPMPAKEYKVWCECLESCSDMAALSEVGGQIKAKNYDEKATKKLGVAYKEAVERIRAANEAPKDPTEATEIDSDAFPG
jgi:hypothetical protein